ncbi:hypothetical protein MC885_005557 [Smutsia gigantea]|nr:hypothetical protein MC885_005557 [Smutsia gigantea]
MGDMKTPGFDGCLAAFDIPDMVHPKAAVQSGPDEPHQAAHSCSYSKDGPKSLKGDVPTSEVTLKDTALSQFSPISSAEDVMTMRRSRAPLQSAVIPNAVAPVELNPKQVTVKPVATAFLPVSAVKKAGSQVINVKLANSTMVKATVISATSVESTSSAIIKGANAIQQHTVVVPASSLASAKHCAPRQP